MLTIVLPQSFVSEICDTLSEEWLNKEQLLKKFNPIFVEAFFDDFKDYLSEGEDDDENGITFFTLGLNWVESEYLKGEILAANQKRLELK